MYCSSFKRVLITYIHWEKTVYVKLLSLKHCESIFRKGECQSNSLACARHIAGYDITIILKQCADYKTKEVFVSCIQVDYSHLYFRRSMPTPVREYKFQKLICQLHFFHYLFIIRNKSKGLSHSHTCCSTGLSKTSVGTFLSLSHLKAKSSKVSIIRATISVHTKHSY